jgi:hypothetical protein
LSAEALAKAEALQDLNFISHLEILRYAQNDNWAKETFCKKGFKNSVFYYKNC